MTFIDWSSAQSLSDAKYLLDKIGLGLIALTFVVGALGLALQHRIDILKDQNEGPRTLSPSQAQAIADAAVKGWPSVHLIIRVVDDPEALQFADSITTAIKASNADVALENAGTIIPAPYGLRLTRIPNDQGKSSVVIAALKAARLSVIVDEMPSGAFPILLIGVKPPPYLPVSSK